MGSNVLFRQFFADQRIPNGRNFRAGSVDGIFRHDMHTSSLCFILPEFRSVCTFLAPFYSIRRFSANERRSNLDLSRWSSSKFRLCSPVLQPTICLYVQTASAPFTGHTTDTIHSLLWGPFVLVLIFPCSTERRHCNVPLFLVAQKRVGEESHNLEQSVGGQVGCTDRQLADVDVWRHVDGSGRGRLTGRDSMQEPSSVWRLHL